VKYFNNYNIDYSKLANLLTPPFLRKTNLIDWLVLLLSPLENTNYNFKIFRSQAIYKVAHNSQVVYLQKVLRDAYDNELRRIIVQNVVKKDITYIYPEADENPIYIYSDGENKPVYIYDSSIFNSSEFDFVVLFPLALKPLSDFDRNIFEIQIKSLINYYKLASKRYKILWTL
jgi:hypothetical protein